MGENENLKLLINTLLSVGAAALISYSLTPLVGKLAHVIGAMDIPTDNRRMHKIPMPRLGGLAIFFGFTISVLAFCDISKELLGLLLGGIGITALGICDDKFHINAWTKLVGEIICSLIPVLLGNTVERVTIMGTTYEFGIWSIPITMFWIVALTNAINLVDGLDGLACGISTISATAILIVTILHSDISVAVLTAILVGACLGFLPFSMHPAKIFMGDTGALFLGFTLSVLSIQGLFKFSAIISFLTPFLIFALPLCDTLFAFVRRVARGQSPFKADEEHIHHKLIFMGVSHKNTVFILYAVTMLLGISAILLSEGNVFSGFLVLSIGLVIGVLDWRLLSRGGLQECFHEPMQEDSVNEKKEQDK